MIRFSKAHLGAAVTRGVVSVSLGLVRVVRGRLRVRMTLRLLGQLQSGSRHRYRHRGRTTLRVPRCSIVTSRQVLAGGLWNAICIRQLQEK